MEILTFVSFLALPSVARTSRGHSRSASPSARSCARLEEGASVISTSSPAGPVEAAASYVTASMFNED